MRHFFLTAVVAVAAAMATAAQADAQIVYNYTRPAPGGVVNGGAAIGPTAASYYSTYYSPFTGTIYSRALYKNSFGQAYGRSYNYNPVQGILSTNTGFFGPGLYFNPYNLSLGLNMHPNFGMGNTYQFYGGFYGRRW
jgi:hypothetical protein